MNIIEALKDEQLLRPFLQDKDGGLVSWRNWMTALRCLYGLRIPSIRRRVVERCTGRKVAKLPRDGFNTALFLTGRRSGKSRIAAVVGSFEAVLAGHQCKLAPGECGVVPIISPTKQQGRIVRDYLRAIFDGELFANEIVGETKQGFELADGKVRIEILAGDFRTVRGYTTLAVICDEVAFMGLDEDARVRSDTELIRAVKPSLATVGGKLICISSPYAKKGWTWKTHQKNFANDLGRTLVWNCDSRTMNREKGEALRALFEKVTLYWKAEFRPAQKKPDRPRKTDRKGRNRYHLLHDKIEWAFTPSNLVGSR